MNIIALEEGGFGIEETKKTVYTKITPTEVIIVQMLSDDKTKKEIGIRLKLSHRTIENKCDVLRAKLGMETMYEVVKFFTKNNLIQ